MTASGEHDVVLAVTGVSAAALLARIAAVRSGAGVPGAPAGDGAVAQAVSGAALSARPVRLLDFGDGTDLQFVEAAHRVLLRRAVTGPERERRLEDLAAGGSRIELLVRLSLCPEGRRAQRRQVVGPGLRTMLAAGATLERASSRPVVAGVLRRAPQAVAAFSDHRGAVRLSTRAVLAGASIGTVLARQRRYREVVAELRRELADLRLGVRS